jgi:hypothetical protein
LPVGLAAAGTALPDTELLDPYTAATTLHAATCNIGVAGAPAAISPLSTYQACLLPQLTERGIRLVAISPAEAGRVADRAAEGQPPALMGSPTPATPPPVTSGSSPRPGEARAAQLQLGLDLTSVNAHGAGTMPGPVAVILDANHTMWWIDAHPDYSTRTPPWQILDALAR